MKKKYVAPCLEVEVYRLDMSIATNCYPAVDLGPDTDGRKNCDYFDDDWDLDSGISVASSGASFYDSDPGYCDCYYTTGGEGYFTS